MARLPDPFFFLQSSNRDLDVVSLLWTTHSTAWHDSRVGVLFESPDGEGQSPLWHVLSEKYAAAMACVVNQKMLYRNRITTW